MEVEKLQADIDRLQGELQQRDLLVQQLSEELFRLVKGNATFAPGTEAEAEPAAADTQLTERIAALEGELRETQAQLQAREAEAVQLRQTVAELTDRTRMLEQVVEELPNVYRAKFAERMVPIKSRVEMLQKENRQLHVELQSLSYRLATRSRPQRLELPKVVPSPHLPALSLQGE